MIPLINRYSLDEMNASLTNTLILTKEAAGNAATRIKVWNSKNPKNIANNRNKSLLLYGSSQKNEMIVGALGGGG